jgi:hypothetical protein
MIEIANGRRYLSREKSLAIASENIRVLMNQIKTKASDGKSLNFLIL